jgi:hypothetical protein
MHIYAYGQTEACQLFSNTKLSLYVFHIKSCPTCNPEVEIKMVEFLIALLCPITRSTSENKHIKRPKVFGCAQIISLLKTEQNHLT